MKILLINHYAGAHKYGMEFRPLYLSKEWQKSGNEVCVIAADQSHIRARNPHFSDADLKPIQGLNSRKFRSEVIDGVKYIWCKTPIYSGNGVGRVINICVFLCRLFQISFWLRKNFLPDLLITSSTYPMDIFPAKWMKLIFSWKVNFAKRPKLIYEVHDLWPLSPIELGGMSRLHPFILWTQLAEDCAYRWADKVVSMLPKTKEYMESRGMLEKKFCYIPNGIDFSEWKADLAGVVNLSFEKSAMEIKNKYNLTVAYFGTHGLANALDYFVLAADLASAQNLSVAFVLVGSGPDKKTLQLMVENKKISNVFFLDPVSKSEIPNALQVFDILYIGLQKQSLFRFGISPNKLIDYMAAGKPVLFAVEAGNNPVQDNACGISVAAESSEAILEGLKVFLKTTSAERSEMGRRGLEFVRQNHDYKILAQNFINEIES